MSKLAALPRPAWLPKLLENWPAKILSVALALALGMVYRVNTLSTRTLIVPLNVVTNGTLTPSGAFPSSVRVQIRGDGDGVLSVADGDLQAFVDLSRHESGGRYRAAVQVKRSGNALAVQPLEVSVNPIEIVLDLDRRVDLSLPLATPLHGGVATGFDLVSHSLNPGEVAVFGPAGLLQGISSLATSPVLLDGRNADFSVTVTIVNPDPLITIGSGTAEFSGVVRATIPVRTIENIPIELTDLAPNLRTDFGERFGSIRIEGSRFRVDGFRVTEGLLSVDASGIIDEGTYTLQVTVNLPDNFILINQNPQSVTFRVRFETSPEEDEIPDEGEDEGEAEAEGADN